MGLINDCARLFSNYTKYNYILTLDCCYTLKIAFKSEHFYHLAGLHYLRDIKEIDNRLPANSAKRIYKSICKNQITQETIEKSKQYSKIKNRLENFLKLDDVINCKIVVDFDYTKVPQTKIQSKYILYTQYNGLYIMLGLKYDDDVLIPETFIVDKTDYYIKNQTCYNVVNIEKEKVGHRKK